MRTPRPPLLPTPARCLLVASLLGSSLTGACVVAAGRPRGPLPRDTIEVEQRSAWTDELLGRARLTQRGNLATLDAVRPDRGSAGNAWVWCHLGVETRLRWPDGRVDAHPDQAVRRELRAGLARTPPDVEGLIAGLSRLRRLESRGELLLEAPPLSRLDTPLRQAWLDAITTGRERWVLAPSPDGCPAGGTSDQALGGPLLRAATWELLDRERAAQVLEAGLGLASLARRAEVVRALLARGDLLPVASLAAACPQLDPEDARKLREALTQREALPLEGLPDATR